jgi:hypothetical protein
MAVDAAKQFALGNHMVSPVTADVTESNVAELADRVAFAGTNHVVVGNLVLQHQMHDPDVVTCKPEVSANVQISQANLAAAQDGTSPLVLFLGLRQTNRYSSGRMRDLLRDIGEGSARAFVIEHDSRRCMNAVVAAISHDRLVGVKLGNSVRRLRTARCGFALWSDGRVAKNFR